MVYRPNSPALAGGCLVHPIYLKPDSQSSVCVYTIIVVIRDRTVRGNMNKIPYHLSEGLFLETSGKLLPWYKSLHQLAKKGGKPRHSNGRTSALYWDNEIIFGGLNASIKAMESGEGLFFIQLKLDKKFESSKTVRPEYDYILDTLIQRFGATSETGVNDIKKPFSYWMWGNICLSLQIGDRFVEYVALSVRKTALN